MIRPATLDDMPDLIRMGRAFHAASPATDLPWDDDIFAASTSAMLENGLVVVCVIEGAVCGMAAVVAGQNWFGPAKCAQEMFWWSEGCGSEAHALRLALEAWAKKQGCVAFGMACVENEKTPVLTRLYRRAGYRPVEHHFMRAL